MKKFLKIFLISLASLLFLAMVFISIALWLIFTPERLTPIVAQQANKYINCQNEIGKVELTFFSTFPKFGLKADRLILINPVDNAPNDTLIHVSEITGIINISSLIKDRELIVNDFRLSNGMIYAFVNSLGDTNFNIFSAKNTPDTLQTEMTLKVVDIENIDLKNVDVSYLNQTMNLKAVLRRLTANIRGKMNPGDITGAIDVKPFDFALEYGQTGSSFLKSEIRNFSAKVAGSLKSGVVSADVDIRPFDAALHYDSDSLKFVTDVRNLSVAISGTTDQDSVSGKIRLEPFWMTFSLGNEKYLQDALIGLNVMADAKFSRQWIHLKEVSVSVNDLKLEFAGTVENDTIRKQTATDLTYRFDSWQLKNIMALVPPSFTSYIANIEANGKLSSEGTVIGVYSPSSMPMMDVRLLYEKGTFRYAAFPVPLNAIRADVNIHTDLKDAKSYVRINSFSAKTPESSIKTEGRITRLFSDMRLDLNTDVDVILSEFAPLIPDSLNITANGKVAGKVKTDCTMSELTNIQLEKIKASGTMILSDFNVDYDSLSVKTDHSTITFALPNPRASTVKTQFVYANISANTLEASKINIFETSLQNARIYLESSDIRDSLKIPSILCSYRMDAFRAKMDSGRISIARPAGNISVAPRRNSPTLPEIQLTYNSNRIKADFGQYAATIENLGLDIEAEHDPKQKDKVLQWTPRGFIDMDNGMITIATLSYPIEIPGIFLKFDPEMIHIERGYAKLDKSDFNLSGDLTNVSSYIRGDSLLRGRLNFVSQTTDIQQIMNITSGIGYDEAEKEAAADSGPYLVPKGMEILLHTDIRNASYSATTTASRIKGDLRVRDGILALDDIAFSTPGADMRVTAHYATTRPGQRKNHLYLGLDLHLLEVEIGELLHMFPIVDSIMPMLRSFAGRGEFHCAAETYVDSMYNVKPTTIRGAVSISGTDMVLMDSKMFSQIAKRLRFEKQTKNKVDSLSAEFTVLGEEIDIYPFLLVMDKYKVVVSGRHNLDMSFNYNISVVQSPLLFRLSVDVTGTPDRPKFKLGKSKFPDFYRPVSRKLVESKQLELRMMIRDALKEGVRREEEYKP